MPRKASPTHPFGKRLVQLRLERGLTQIDLAKLISSTQRNISHYETVAPPPASVLIKIAKVLGVSTDELLGVRAHQASAANPYEDPEVRRLWRKFQRMRDLPVKDQRAVIRLINSLFETKKAS